MSVKEDLFNFDSNGYKLSKERIGARFMLDLENGTYAFLDKDSVRCFPFGAEGNIADILECCDDLDKEKYEFVRNMRMHMEENGEFSDEDDFAFDTPILLKSKNGSYVQLIASLCYEFDNKKKSFVSVTGALHSWNAVVQGASTELVSVSSGRAAGIIRQEY